MESGRPQCLSEDDARALIAGDLPPDRYLAVEAHLDGCAACRELLTALVGGGSGTPRPAADLTGATRPAARAEPLPLVAPGTWIGNYRVDRPIGAGAMGVVYRGVDRSLERPVAIKLLSRAGDDRLDPIDHARMERESRALARLSHRNVVTVYQIGEHEGRRYLALEYVEGGTVREWLAASPRPASEIVELFVQAGRGLAAVHEAGFIHRDIKPDNLLVGADGRVRVGDFGLVRSAADAGDDSPAATRQQIEAALARSPRLTETGSIMGTPRYMAPELLRGERADQRSDQWSYCASLWEALAGAPAYPGDLVTALDRGGQPRPPAEPDRLDRIPRRLRRLLLRGLAHRPGDRWPSMRELVSAIEGGRRRARATAAVLVAGAAAGIALGIGLGGGGGRQPDPCAAAGGELAATWNRARRERLAAAFGSPDYRAGAARSIDRLLDRHAASWREARRAACVAAGRAPGEAALTGASLDRRRAAFEALLAALERPPADPVVALDAAADLPAIDDCGDATWLANLPPAAPQQRGRIAGLRGELEAAWVEHRLGRAGADRSARQVLERARSTGFAPLLADSLRLAGAAARAAGAPDARALVEESLTAAEAAADDVLVADARVDLVDLAAAAGDQAAAVDRLLRHARAVATRLERVAPTAHDRTLAELGAVEGRLLRRRGQLDRAESSLRDALEREARGAAAPSPRVARAHARLAEVLLARGRSQGAAAERARADRLARELVGPAAAPRLLRE